jgi:Cu-processing system permease protein
MGIASINHPTNPPADQWAPPGFARQITSVAAKELRDSLRNRWFPLYAVLFAVLTSALAWISMAGSGMDGMAGFGRTAAGLVNVVLLIVPLMALTVGAGTIAGERDRGTLEYLLAHPITRGELLFGKLLGSALALLTTLTLGFGISMLVVAWRGLPSRSAAF